MACSCAGKFGKKHARVLGIIIAFLVFAAVAIGITMLVLSRLPSPPGSTQEVGYNNWLPSMGQQPVPHKVFLISVGDDFGGHDARGHDGSIIGFGMEMIRLVCEEAGIDCRTVAMSYDNCWVTGGEQRHSYGGKGLHTGWIDVCSGWFVTLERLSVFTFAQSYMVPEYGYMFYKQGSSFNPYNLEGKKIGFLAGWVHDEICLKHTDGIRGRDLPHSHKIYYNTVLDAVISVESGETDAFIAPWSSVEVLSRTRKITYKAAPKFACMLSGQAMMTRKDSDFPALWNIGFQKARYKGRFRKICEDANIKFSHLGSISCVDSQNI